MLPPISSPGQRCLAMAPARLVVVVFPFEPVIAQIFPLQYLKNRFISVSSGTPAPTQRSTRGMHLGMAGLSTTRSASSRSSSLCSPSTQLMSRSARPASSFSSSLSVLRSVTVTRASCESRKRVTPAPPPKDPRPTTVTFLSRNHSRGWMVFENIYCLRAAVTGVSPGGPPAPFTFPCRRPPGSRLVPFHRGPCAGPHQSCRPSAMKPRFGEHRGGERRAG